MSWTGLDIDQFQDLVIDDSLEAAGLFSPEASELLLGTAIQESRLRYLTQLDGDSDPYDDALGFFQVERVTHDDIWTNWLSYRPAIADQVLVCCGFTRCPDAREMVTNLRYAALMARLVYRRKPEPLPAVGDIAAQASYWKRHYNTAGGHGTVEQYIANWQRSI